MVASRFASIGVRKELGKILSSYAGLFLKRRTKHLILLGELSAKALVLNARQKETAVKGPAAACYPHSGPGQFQALCAFEPLRLGFATAAVRWQCQDAPVSVLLVKKGVTLDAVLF